MGRARTGRTQRPVFVLTVLAATSVVLGIVVLLLIVRLSLDLPKLSAEDEVVAVTETVSPTTEPASPTSGPTQITPAEPTTNTISDSSTTTDTTGSAESSDGTSRTTSLGRNSGRNLLEFSEVLASSATTAAGTDACGNPTLFGPPNLTDGLEETAWRASGTGVGKTITIRLPRPAVVAEVGLTPGYLKDNTCEGGSFYSLNRRISRVIWTIGDVEIVQDLDPASARMQIIAFDPPLPGDQVTMEIVATTGHLGRNFTLISELHLSGLDT